MAILRTTARIEGSRSRCLTSSGRLVFFIRNEISHCQAAADMALIMVRFLERQMCPGTDRAGGHTVPGGVIPYAWNACPPVGRSRIQAAGELIHAFVLTDHDDGITGLNQGIGRRIENQTTV